MQLYINVFTQEIGSAEAWRKRKCQVKVCAQMVKVDRVDHVYVYRYPSVGGDEVFIRIGEAKMIPDNIRQKRKEK